MTGRRGAYILTFTGRIFWPLDPRPNEIDIEDIAHHLANLCRYTGACKEFYSVAEHSCHISDLAENKLWGLLHDASEAYLGDLARPTKQAGTGFGEAFQVAERRIMRAVCDRFKLPTAMPTDVDFLDDAVLEAEARVLMGRLPNGRMWWTETHQAADVTIGCWSPRRAKREFLARFEALTRGGT